MKECIFCKNLLSYDYWSLQGLDYRGQPDQQTIELYYCNTQDCPRYGLYTKVILDVTTPKSLAKGKK